MVAGIALLFIGGLLLLVDHDEANALERREKRRARTDDDVGDPIEDAPPLVETLARRQGAVQKRDAVPETRDEPRDDLRGEDDLRHQDDHAVAARERRRRRTEIHLGLAARGHPVKEEAATRSERPRDRADGHGLGPGRRKIPSAILVREGKFGGYASDRARADDNEPALCECARRGGRSAGVGEIA